MKIQDMDGVIVPGGFGYRGIEGKISAIEYIRKKQYSIFRYMLGLQCAVIEFARNVCGIDDANLLNFQKTQKLCDWFTTKSRF